MANIWVADENWQTTRPLISERTAFLFNNELLSDVKFVVPTWNDASDFKSTIPAHKFVLAISSPVFFAMFYGQIAETTDSIEILDCDRASLLELFHYLYSDKVNLSGGNVMKVLYLAKKYMVPSLVEKCNDFLRDNLKASNVLCILPYAQKFEDTDLEERCWKVISTRTKETVSCREFESLDRFLVESIVKKDGLNIKEVELFQAVDRWATEECKRQRVTPDDDYTKREILGDEIVKAIRFPLMSHEEFASVVIDCNILTLKEVGELVKYYADVPLPSQISFPHTPRIGPFERCFRFGKFVSVEEGGWYYHSSTNEIRFRVNKDVVFYGVQHFGSEKGEYEVSVRVNEPSIPRSRFLRCRASRRDIPKSGCEEHYNEAGEKYSRYSYFTKASGSYHSVKDDEHPYFGFDVIFDQPIWLESSKIYEIVSNIKGPDSWYGLEGKEFAECAGVTFEFRNPCSCVTGVSRGQFPALIFTL